MATWTVTLDGHTATVNELLRTVRGRIKLKKRDRDWVCLACKKAGVAPAEGRRRVSLVVEFPPGKRRCDVDGYWKSLLDALKHAGAIKNDSPVWLEHGSAECVRGERLRTVITLEDLEA